MVWRKPRRVDLFGDIEVKSVEDDFYLGSQNEVYEVLDDSGRYLATVESKEKSPRITEIDDEYFSRVLAGFERPDKCMKLEQVEESIASEFSSEEQINLEYSADLGLVEAVEEVAL